MLYIRNDVRVEYTYLYSKVLINRIPRVLDGYMRLSVLDSLNKALLLFLFSL